MFKFLFLSVSNQHPVTKSDLEELETKFSEMMNEQKENFTRKIQAMEIIYDRKIKDIEKRHYESLNAFTKNNKENLEKICIPILQLMQRLLLITQNLKSTVEVLRGDVENLELDVDDLLNAENEEEYDAE